MDGFNRAKEEHEVVSSVGKFNVSITGEDQLNQISKSHGATKFKGYSQIEGEGEVLAMLRDGKIVEHLEEGDEAELILSETPFYAESGGQLGDMGKLTSDDSKLTVLDTKKHDKLHIHKVRVTAGTIEVGQKLHAAVDKSRRESTVLHHSSAHIFHSAIRELFGKQVTQAGSQVGPSTMRFDFTLDRQPSSQELAQIESMMNEWIRTNTTVKTEEMPIEEAKRTGAIAMFGEKYGEVVRVVRMGDFSLEFCGGTHVSNTTDIGLVKIISEGSIASGVRRIELVAGTSALQYISKQMSFLNDATKRLKSRPEDLANQIERLQESLKEKERLAQNLKNQLALARVPQILAESLTVGDIQLMMYELNDFSVDELKTMAEEITSRPTNSVVVLASIQDTSKVALVAAVSASLINRGIKADNIIKQAAPIIGGSGGGRAQLAQAGGKEPGKVKEAFASIKEGLSTLNQPNSAPIAHT
jgi:alanyl-tRNA synthetase